jgi:hypothetical protein
MWKVQPRRIASIARAPLLKSAVNERNDINITWGTTPQIFAVLNEATRNPLEAGKTKRLKLLSIAK